MVLGNLRMRLTSALRTRHVKMSAASEEANSTTERGSDCTKEETLLKEKNEGHFAWLELLNNMTAFESNSCTRYS